MRIILKTIILFNLLVFLCAGLPLKSEEFEIEVNNIKKIAKEEEKSAFEWMTKFEYLKAINFLKDALNNNIKADYTSGIILNNAEIGKVYVMMKDYN